MAKNNILTDDVLEMIQRIHEANPDLKAGWVANEVRRQLGKKKSKNGTWPADVTVRSWIRKLKPSPEDMPWSMATLDQDYPAANAAIGTAIPVVLKVWAERLEKKHETLSIREAKWVARLHEVKPEIEELSARAAEYARAERIYESMGRPFISAALDAGLMGFTVTYSGAGREAVLHWFATDEEMAEAERMRQEKPNVTKAEIIAEVEAALKRAAANPQVDASLLVGDSGSPRRMRKGGK